MCSLYKSIIYNLGFQIQLLFLIYNCLGVLHMVSRHVRVKTLRDLVQWNFALCLCQNFSSLLLSNVTHLGAGTRKFCLVLVSIKALCSVHWYAVTSGTRKHLFANNISYSMLNLDFQGNSFYWLTIVYPNSRDNYVGGKGVTGRVWKRTY